MLTRGLRDLTDPEIPEAFYTMTGLSFSANWHNEHEEWEKFKDIFIKVKQQVPAGIQEISCIESDEPSKINSILQSVNQNTTNRSDNGTPLHQQLGTCNQHDLAEMQSNDSSVIYHRNSIHGHGLVSNNSAIVPIATILPFKSTTIPSQNAANNQSTTQTGVGLTSSVTTPPSTTTSFTGRNTEENIILPHRDQTSTAMQMSDNGEPLDDAAPSTHSQNSSDTKLKEIVGRDTIDKNGLLCSLKLNEEELENCDQSNSIDNQVSTDSLKTETEKSQVCSQQSDHIERSVCPNSNPHHDCGNDQGLNLQSILNDHQNTNGSNTYSIGINRVNDYIPPVPNNSDGYETMD
ncbi:uncharacterized protein LOC134714756 isoform X2 [Mytilus trossulus]|uniref:uncharacterized protein LOC134714756 isoform X2 n=1 Tax=Mytilus trossulus TaxID=6551 RepID=UPI00300472C4